MCSHSVLLVAPESTHAFAFLIKFFGTLGVDVFFVLSGFLIGGILLKLIENQNTTPKGILYFWIRRWFRTLPNYYLILLINILILNFTSEESLFIWKYVFFLQNFNSAQPDFFTESWSLTIEEFAYIILPLLLLFCNVLFKKSTKKVFLIITILIITLVCYNRVHFHYNISNFVEDINWSHSLRKVLIYRLDAIYIGFIGAYIFKFYINLWHKYKYAFLGCGVIIFSMLHGYIVLTNSLPNINSFFFNVLYLPLISVSILCCFPVLYDLDFKGKLKTLVTKISKWSYALYLVNYSLVLLSIKRLFSIENLSFETQQLFLLIFWLISFLLAYVLYRFYEKPMTSLRESSFVLHFFKH